jgi:hypothetical protein
MLATDVRGLLPHASDRFLAVFQEVGTQELERQLLQLAPAADWPTVPNTGPIAGLEVKWNEIFASSRHDAAA